MSDMNKRDRESYLEINHKESPGTTWEDVAHIPGAFPVGRGQVFKSATVKCNHCEKEIILNPDRSRERNYCPKCDFYICDWCEAERIRTGECLPFAKIVENWINRVEKGQDPWQDVPSRFRT